MNSTTVSSFAPLEYYKKLTNCLANRKNLKLNLSKIHGAKNIPNHKNNPFTNRKIQSKFLAKYNNLKRQPSQKQVAARDAIFNIKHNEEKGKRKKEDESSYINLPDKFFDHHKTPDLSIFKIPAVPPIKKQRTDCIDTSSNFTLASLFSGNFNPPQFSTPIDVKAVRDEPKPIIADPNELLASFHDTQQDVQAAEKLRIEKERAEKLKAFEEEIKQHKIFMDGIKDSGKHLDYVCFGEEDPTDCVMQRLSSKFETASQSPRESLLSCTKETFETPKLNKIKTQSWPVPVFYDEPENENAEPFVDSDPEDDTYYESLFEFTKNIFGFLEQDDEEDDPLIFTPPSKFDRKIDTSNSFLFNTPNIWSSSSTNSFMSAPEGMAFSPFPFAEKPKYSSKFKDDLEWLGEAFDSKMDMSWESESNFSMPSVTYQDNLRSDVSAIFRSPPKNSVKESFSRIIARPKKIFKEELDDTFRSNDDFSWWQAKEVKSDTSFMLNQTPNIFDDHFSLF